MRKIKRQQRRKYRKNFLPTLIATAVLWVLVALLIYFIDPQATGAVTLFFALVFMSLLFTLSLAFANTRRGLIASVAITLFFILKVLGIGNVVNLILLLGLSIAVEILFSNGQ